jgi:hypothetical protein
MNSDIFVTSIDYKDGWADELAKIAKEQIQRDDPRKFAAMALDPVQMKIVCAFELVAKPAAVA